MRVNAPRLIFYSLISLFLLTAVVACSGSGGVGMGGLDERAAALQREIAAATASAQAGATATSMAGTSIAEATSISIQATDHVIQQTVVAGYTTATSVAAATFDSATAVALQNQQVADAARIAATGTAEANKAAYERELAASQARLEQMEVIWRQAEIVLKAGFALVVMVLLTYGGIKGIKYFTHGRREIRTVGGEILAPAGMYETPRRHPTIDGEYEMMNRQPAGLLTDQQDRQPAGQIVELPRQLRPGEIGIGVNAEDASQSVYVRLEQVAIMAVGLPDMGKSAFLNSAAYQAKKQGWQLLLADPEHNSFPPEIWGHVAATLPEFDETLDIILSEMDRRLSLFGEARVQLQHHVSREEWFDVSTLSAYNRAAGILGLRPLPPLLFIADEANTFLGKKSETDEKLFTFLRGRRKVGIGFIPALHNMHAATIPTIVTDLLPIRLAFFCQRRTSRVVIGRPDAATRLTTRDKGRVFTWGLPYEQIQTYYVTPERIKNEIKATPLVMPPVTWNMRGDGSNLLTAGNGNGNGNGIPNNLLVEPDFNDDDEEDDFSGRNGNANTAGQVDEEYRQRVVELRRQGLALRRINMELHGSTGGPTFDTVRAICIEAGLYDPDRNR